MSLRKRVAHSLVWQGLGAGGERLLRFTLNIVVARILSPEDFGLAAMVMVVYAGVEAVTFFASNQAIIRSERGRDHEFLSTVFWFAVVRGVMMCVALVALARPLAAFFDASEHVALFGVIALRPILIGLASPRAQLYRKDLQFHTWAAYRLVSAGLGTLATLSFAIWLENAWALVVGQLATEVFLTLGSHLIAPFVPGRLDRGAAKEIRTLALRSAGTPVLEALISQAPAILLGKLGGAAVLGVFHINYRLARIPVELAVRVLAPVGVPAYAMISHDRARLARSWLAAVKLTSFASLSIGAAMAAIGSGLPSVLYGDAYSGTSSLFPLLALSGSISAIAAAGMPIFWAAARPDLGRRSRMAQFVLVYGLGLFATPRLGSEGMAMALLAAAFVATSTTLVIASRHLQLGTSAMLRALTPGVLAAPVVAGLVVALRRIGEISTLGMIVGAAALTLALIPLGRKLARRWLREA